LQSAIHLADDATVMALLARGRSLASLTDADGTLHELLTRAGAGTSPRWSG